MTGLLSRIDRRRPGAGATGRDAVIRRARSPGTEESSPLLSDDDALGSVDTLLAELNFESELLAGNPRKPGAPSPELGDTSPPWWLLDPPKPNPRVDLVIAAARPALADLLADDRRGDVDLAPAVRKAVQSAAASLGEGARVTAGDVQLAAGELVGLLAGKGPLAPLYDDPAVTDVFLDGHGSIKCARNGQALETPFTFRDPQDYSRFVSSLLASAGHALGADRPVVDCVLGDEWRSRVNAVHQSVCESPEPRVVIRIPRIRQVTFYDLLKTKTLPPTLAAWLAEVVSIGKTNVLVAGPSGSGKTTLTTALLASVNSDERVCTIEDVPELFVPTPHLEKLVSRSGDGPAGRAVGADELLRAVLRRSPHRIVVGEIRDREGVLFLRALETGHAGSVATVHAGSARDALWRLLDVVAAGEGYRGEAGLVRRISRVVRLVVTMRRENGTPCLDEVTEVVPAAGGAGEFSLRSVVRFAGREGGRRVWRLSTDRAPLVDEMSAEGVLLRPAQSLLPAGEKAGEDVG